MTPKFGKKFEEVSKLFDRAAHNGSNYLNEHCFVSTMLCVPVCNRQKISYHAVPLGYRMWRKKKSKLQLAVSMVRSRKVIEMPVNLINISYCAMKLLPYLEKPFSK